MQLTFRDIEKAFKAEEKTLYEWINDRGMPAVKAHGQYYFNSVEVLEWALKFHIPLTPGALKLCDKNRPGQDIFSSALLRGGVHFAIQGTRRDEVLEKVIDLFPLAGHIQRPFLKEMLLSREQSGTTAIGNGIAIPHVKHPVILAGLESAVGLFFLENQIDFDALDGKPVHILFVILSNSFKGHLSLLARLAFCLQDKNVQSSLDRRSNPEEILATFQIAESKTAGKS